MRVSLRLGLIIAITAILVGTLLISAGLTYWHAVNKLDVEMKSTLAAVQRTIRVAIQDIGNADGADRQIQRLVRTFDDSRHVRVSLLNSDGRMIARSRPAPPANDMPEWFYHLISIGEETAHIDIAVPQLESRRILVTADPRNEAGEVWGDSKLQLTSLAVFCVLALAILSALLGYALSPLNKLLPAFERIGSGKFGEQVPVSGSSEFVQLAGGFNRMSSLLKEMDDKNTRLDQQLEAVQEEERASLARDLHDDVGPVLFSIDVDAITIREMAASKGETGVAERAGAIQSSIALLKDHVRAILWQLRPGVLLSLGLSNAIESLVANLKTQHPEVNFTLNVPDRSWRPQIDIALLSVIREAVNNALKHSRPANIAISIAEKGMIVEAVIRNDGGPIKPPQHAGRMGVIGMRERASLAGGTLDIIDTSDGAGVEVRLSLPLIPSAIPATHLRSIQKKTSGSDETARH